MREKILVSALFGGFGAIAGDVKSFLNARKIDRGCRFEWDLMLVKFLWGAITLGLGATGYSAVTGQEPSV